MSLSCQSGTIDGFAIFVTAKISENEPRPTPSKWSDNLPLLPNHKLDYSQA